MSPFMRLFCCWFSFFLARGCFCSCGREGCAMSYLIEVVFLFIWWFFFNDLMKYNHGFFFVRFSVSCFFKKRKVFFLLICKKGFCWMNWIVCRMSCRRILFVVDSFFFLHVVASVLVGRKVVQCLIWFEVVFLFIWWLFFNDSMKYNHGFFPVVFLWDFLCLVSLRRGRFFSCWFVKKVFVEWIGSFVEWDVGEFVFFSDSNFSVWD